MSMQKMPANAIVDPKYGRVLEVTGETCQNRHRRGVCQLTNKLDKLSSAVFTQTGQSLCFVHNITKETAADKRGGGALRCRFDVVQLNTSQAYLFALN